MYESFHARITLNYEVPNLTVYLHLRIVLTLTLKRIDLDYSYITEKWSNKIIAVSYYHIKIMVFGSEDEP